MLKESTPGTNLVRLPKPASSAEGMVHIDCPPIFEQQAIVETGDRAGAPPLIIDPPAFQDYLGDKAATGQVDSGRLACVCGFDANTPGSVEGVSLFRRR